MVHAGCVFVTGIHRSRTWTSGSIESVRWNACLQRLDLGVYSHLSFWGMESETMLTPKEKPHYQNLKRSNLWCCITQDSKPNTLPTELFRPPLLLQTQTCLPQNTSVCTLNSRCPYFQIFDWTFLRMHHQSVKTKQCQRSIFYHSSCKNSVWTHIFNNTDAVHLDDAVHSDNFILFTSAKVVLNQRPHNTFSKKMHRVCCFRWCQWVLSWTVVVWSKFVSLVSCILPPLCWFRAATFDWQLQTRHKGRRLTSVTFRCKVDVHWFNKLFWPVRTGHILQPCKCNCQGTITHHQRSTIGSAGYELAFVHVAISVLSGNSVSVFWEIRAYIRTAGRFPYKYGLIQTGRQVCKLELKLLMRSWAAVWC